MDTIWPWLAVAGAGALHGLNPLAGWGPAAALALRKGRRHRWAKALGAIAVGHLVSVVLVAAVLAGGSAGGSAGGIAGGLAGGLAEGPMSGRMRLAALALVAVALLAARHAWRRRAACSRSEKPTSTSDAVLGGWGLGLWSFVAATAHGAGMMLLPALAPLCLGTTVGRELTASGSLMLALSVVAVHAAAMLGTMGVAALVATRVWGASRRRRLRR